MECERVKVRSKKKDFAGFTIRRIALSRRAAKIEMDSIFVTRQSGTARWGKTT